MQSSSRGPCQCVAGWAGYSRGSLGRMASRNGLPKPSPRPLYPGNGCPSEDGRWLPLPSTRYKRPRATCAIQNEIWCDVMQTLSAECRVFANNTPASTTDELTKRFSLMSRRLEPGPSARERITSQKYPSSPDQVNNPADRTFSPQRRELKP